MKIDLFAWICQKSVICVNWPMIRREALGLLPNNRTFSSSDASDLSTCHSKFMVDGFNRDSLINMDQASIYIDLEARTTYSES